MGKDQDAGQTQTTTSPNDGDKGNGGTGFRPMQDGESM